jgi:predicted nucleotidyltransferase
VRIARLYAGTPLVNMQFQCDENKIKEIALFGSAIRDDFNKDSDVDLLVVFTILNNARIIYAA